LRKDIGSDVYAQLEIVIEGGSFVCGAELFPLVFVLHAWLFVNTNVDCPTTLEHALYAALDARISEEAVSPGAIRFLCRAVRDMWVG
jgi:hypothetical protein